MLKNTRMLCFCYLRLLWLLFVSVTSRQLQTSNRNAQGQNNTVVFQSGGQILYPGHGNSYSVRKNTGSLKVKRTEVIYFGLVSFSDSASLDTYSRLAWNLLPQPSQYCAVGNPTASSL